MMNIKRLNFVWPYIIVELYMDDRVYATHSLPGRIAGCTTLYHRSELTYWQDRKPRTRERLIDPKLGIQDTTNYLEESGRSLTPGVRVSSAPLINQGHAIISRSTTAGVVLRNAEGQVRLTVANHGFLESEEVFHPTTNDFKIGEISERWPAQDVALVKLDLFGIFTTSKRRRHCDFYDQKSWNDQRLADGSVWTECPLDCFFSFCAAFVYVKRVGHHQIRFILIFPTGLQNMYFA